MTHNSFYFLPLFALAGCAGKTEKPNVIIIIADDLGYGDVSAYGSTTISTPNIDRLAKGGVSFTNGYSTSATSTPSRYALMTGLYPMKNNDAKILPGDAPLIIGEKQYTLPRMMQQNGYVTGAVGKWHLGMGRGKVNWNKEITPGAKQVGFDYSYLMAATNDRVPTVYIENGRVVGLDPNDPIEVSYEENFDGEPTSVTNPEMLKLEAHYGHDNTIVNGIGRIGFMKGGKAARWVDEDMADNFLEKVKCFIDQNKKKPFFLYYGLHQPHAPRVPNQRFVGSTTMGARGDVIMEADWCVGQLIDHLEKNRLLENTLIIFSSDNGPVLIDGYRDNAHRLAGNHKPAGGLRSGKYSLFDAGTHVPFFAYWKGRIKPTVSDALICQIDLAASLAALTGSTLPAGLDSQNLLPALLGKNKQGRGELLLEAEGRFAFRKGDWVLIPPYNGWAYHYVDMDEGIIGNEMGNLPDYALYNLKTDPSQKENLVTQEPERFEQMKDEFLAITNGYRTRQLRNNVPH